MHSVRKRTKNQYTWHVKDRGLPFVVRKWPANKPGMGRKTCLTSPDHPNATQSSHETPHWCYGPLVARGRTYLCDKCAAFTQGNKGTVSLGFPKRQSDAKMEKSNQATLCKSWLQNGQLFMKLAFRGLCCIITFLLLYMCVSPLFLNGTNPLM